MKPKIDSGLWQKKLLLDSLRSGLRKCDPRILYRNPVMFCVEIGALLTHSFFSKTSSALSAMRALSLLFKSRVWLWLTVLFANFAESLAESRGKAQAENLRRTKKDLTAKLLSRREQGLQHRRRLNPAQR